MSLFIYSTYSFIFSLQISNFILNQATNGANKFKLLFEIFLSLYNYTLKIVFIFVSTYNLNIMLRVQEICKQQNITMQELAKRMGITYQALYAAVSGNPTIGKLSSIAEALDVPMTDLFEQPQRCTASINCPHCGKSITIKVE